MARSSRNGKRNRHNVEYLQIGMISASKNNQLPMFLH